MDLENMITIEYQLAQANKLFDQANYYLDNNQLSSATEYFNGASKLLLYARTQHEMKSFTGEL